MPLTHCELQDDCQNLALQPATLQYEMPLCFLSYTHKFAVLGVKIPRFWRTYLAILMIGKNEKKKTRYSGKWAITLKTLIERLV